MKWAWLIFGALALAVVAIVIVGWLLPARHQASRTAVFQRQAAEVYATLRDFAAGASWRSGLTGVELLPPRDGRPAFRETSRHGTITYVVLEERPAQRLVTQIADENLPFGGTWTFDLIPEAGVTRVRITENGEVKNPVFRFMARFVFGYTATIDGYLRDLGRKFGQTVTPTG